MKANKRHFHVWHLAKGGRAMFRQARAFNTHQSARKYAKRRGEDPERFEVKECWDARCRVPLEGGRPPKLPLQDGPRDE